MNLIFSTYLNSQPDPQRKHTWDADPETMRAWCDSLANTSGSAVVLTDCMLGYAAEFPQVKFIECEVPKQYSLNDFRFRPFRDFCDGYDFALLTDISDVELKRDPFDYMRPGLIYIGSNDSWATKPKQLSRLAALTAVEPYLARPLLNPGILGGDVGTLQEFITDCLPLLGAQFNNNMPVVNVIGYSSKWHSRIITGYPLHSRFKKYEKSTSAYIRHK